MSRIGYNSLSEAEKRAYDLLLPALESRADTIDAAAIDRNIDTLELIQTILGDNPHIIYFDKTTLKEMTSILLGKRIKLTVLPKNKAEEMERELAAAADKAAEEIKLLSPVTDYDKLLYTYEYIQDHIVYDEDELRAVCSGGVANPLSHNAYGALVMGKGVCDGIASAFALVAGRVGVDCSLVHGEALFRTTDYSDHAWNIARIGERFYHLDATWDTNNKTVSGEYFYDYFCVDDSGIGTGHNWNINTTPPCSDSGMNYFIRSGCFANNLTQFDEIVARIARSRSGVVRVKIADGIAIEEPQQAALGARFSAAMTAAKRSGKYTYTWNKSSRCFYAKITS